jgi:hypothetical protein
VAAVVLVAAIVVFWNQGESGSTDAFCKSARSGENPLDVFDRYDPTNVDSARQELQRGVDRLKELERAAPGEIHDDMKVLVDVAQKLIAALAPSDSDKGTATSIPDFTSEFDRVQEASANVVRFATDKCGLVLDTGTTAPVATLPPQTSATG